MLGRHRPDDSRRGWISGLADEEGERHPTRGGLRIGKELPERRADQPFDPRLEWERDGQYFHYLTQWMHALHRRSARKSASRYSTTGHVELAQTAHARFTRSDAPGGRPRMVWKMSIDLGRVLVPSMGQHDPLDALLAYLELRADGRELDREIREARALCAHAEWETDDPLGIGALLIGIFRLADVITRFQASETELMARLVAAARLSLEACMASEPLSAPADARLAFREFGLAIGLHAIERVRPSEAFSEGVREALAALADYLPLAAVIEDSWSDPANRQSRSWKAHEDINGVMLATSLSPRGYLGN